MDEECEVTVRFAGEQMVSMEKFLVPRRYVLEPEGLGSGGYGFVAAAMDEVSKRAVAIKKLHSVFVGWGGCNRYKAALREVLLLEHLSQGTPEIIQLRDLFVHQSATRESFNDVYLVMDRYDCSLRQLLNDDDAVDELIPSKRALLVRQLLTGIHAIHKAGFVHRDIKPENLLIRNYHANPDLAICDMGSGRTVDIQATQGTLVTTWCYVPPECFLESMAGGGAGGMITTETSHYDAPFAYDVWSAGCVFFELISGGIRLFENALRGPPSALMAMAGVLGPPPVALVDRINPTENVKSRLLATKPSTLEHYMREVYPSDLFISDETPDGCTPTEFEVLNRMIRWDPLDRTTIPDALSSPFFADVGETLSSSSPVPEFAHQTPSDISEGAARAQIWRVVETFREKQKQQQGQ